MSFLLYEAKTLLFIENLEVAFQQDQEKAQLCPWTPKEYERPKNTLFYYITTVPKSNAHWLP